MSQYFAAVNCESSFKHMTRLQLLGFVEECVTDSAQAPKGSVPYSFIYFSSKDLFAYRSHPLSLFDFLPSSALIFNFFLLVGVN